MKRITLLPILLLLLVLSSCTEDKFADWKILNDQKYAAEIVAKSTDNTYKTTDSGLCYKIIYAGNMKQPNASSYVEVRYTGKLITGKVFDSGTYKGSLSSTVSGWQEAISMLKVGGSMELFFPYTLGYNSTDKGTIPPYSMLYFTVELLDAQY